MVGIDPVRRCRVVLGVPIVSVVYVCGEFEGKAADFKSSTECMLFNLFCTKIPESVRDFAYKRGRLTVDGGFFGERDDAREFG